MLALLLQPLIGVSRHRSMQHMSAQPIPNLCTADFMHFTDVSQLPPHRLAEIRRFFADYKAAVSCCLLNVSLMLSD